MSNRFTTFADSIACVAIICTGCVLFANDSIIAGMVIGIYIVFSFATFGASRRSDAGCSYPIVISNIIFAAFVALVIFIAGLVCTIVFQSQIAVIANSILGIVINVLANPNAIGILIRYCRLGFNIRTVSVLQLCGGDGNFCITRILHKLIRNGLSTRIQFYNTAAVTNNVRTARGCVQITLTGIQRTIYHNLCIY